MEETMNTSDSDQENNNNIANQMTSQQRKLCYRNLLNEVEEIQESEDLSLGTVKKIGDILKQVNNIDKKYKVQDKYQHPDETLLDSVVLSSASKLLVKCVGSLDIDVATYEPAEFADKIMNYVSDGSEFETQNLLKLLDDVHTIIPQVPEYSLVYGTYDLVNLPQPKQKKERQAKIKETLERKAPEKVTNLEKEEKSIDAIQTVFIEVLNECYEKNGKQPIKYYDYIIDTDSFANTVENIFYCSFLVRDGKACIDLDGRGIPYIKPIPKRQLKAFRDERGKNSQVISSISVPEWETYKREGYLQLHRKRRQT